MAVGHTVSQSSPGKECGMPCCITLFAVSVQVPGSQRYIRAAVKGGLLRCDWWPFSVQKVTFYRMKGGLLYLGRWRVGWRYVFFYFFVTFHVKNGEIFVSVRFYC